ncbi:low molecular weight protein-tyrosine-phosphatase [Halorubrum californiense DSM 19288]|uniref:Low molecular weight protein-tyrosine-phosphatase n=1 Tax=Halorubrum californiense DSM 19288 TaxID=1227465 RepID=M0E0V5_9EURY|nr:MULTISPECIES: low molecular weight phosphatase family protein [Halorubrum]ELZ40562.1 low molecular weight protein-tyrosine-phosphatase [Halorubrum californiense DSM 19288]TKX72847.1 low molecular weight phosphatase family protein [Halorubrum sp. GN11GM_10-3_MGM]
MTLADSIRGRSKNELKRILANGIQHIDDLGDGHLLSIRWDERTFDREEFNILFLCYGNICRSPFAERYAKQQLSNSVTVRSSGFYTEVDRPSPPAAVKAASEFGVNLGNHRSSVVDSPQIQSADLVVVMDYENVVDLLRERPRSLSDVTLLGSVPESQSTVIRDPYGGSVTQFRETYQEITKATDALIRALF